VANKLICITFAAISVRYTNTDCLLYSLQRWAESEKIDSGSKDSESTPKPFSLQILDSESMPIAHTTYSSNILATSAWTTNLNQLIKHTPS